AANSGFQKVTEVTARFRWTAELFGPSRVKWIEWVTYEEIELFVVGLAAHLGDVGRLGTDGQAEFKGYAADGLRHEGHAGDGWRCRRECAPCHAFHGNASHGYGSAHENDRPARFECS